MGFFEIQSHLRQSLHCGECRPLKRQNHRESDPTRIADAELPNFTENQRVVEEMSMLDEVAAEAARLAEAQTQPAGLDTEVDSMGSMGDQSRIAKKQAVENGVNGTPVATATGVDGPGQTPKEDRDKHSSTLEMEHEEERYVPRTHTVMFTATEFLQ